jgi:hypothetical protein
MSFNTGGHAVYLTGPKKLSAPNALGESNGSILVFTTVPSDADPETLPESTGTLVPAPLIGGRVVG